MSTGSGTLVMVSQQNVTILFVRHVFTGAYRLFAVASLMVVMKAVVYTSVAAT